MCREASQAPKGATLPLPPAQAGGIRVGRSASPQRGRHSSAMRRDRSGRVSPPFGGLEPRRPPQSTGWRRWQGERHPFGVQAAIRRRDQGSTASPRSLFRASKQTKPSPQKKATALVKRLAARYAPPSCGIKLSRSIITDAGDLQDQFAPLWSGRSALRKPRWLQAVEFRRLK
jgi:hypothetical protein